MTAWLQLASRWPAPRTHKETEAIADVTSEAVSLARRDPDAFWDWFLTLGRAERLNGSLVANVLWSWAGRVPQRAFEPLVRAAIEEDCPSFNKTFVTPLVRAFGATVVKERLSGLLDSGTLEEKRGARQALYWANSSVRSPEDLERQANLIAANADRVEKLEVKFRLREQAIKRRRLAEDMRRDFAGAWDDSGRAGAP